MSAAAGNVTTVSSLLAGLQPEDPAATRRRKRRAYLAAYASALLIYVIAVAGGLLNISLVGRTDRWDTFWTGAVVLAIWGFVPVLFLLNPALRGVVPGAKTRDTALALREVAAQGDERLAPLVLFQPLPLEGAEAPSGAVRIGPLQPFPTTNNGVLFQTLASVAFLVTIGVWIALLVAGSNTPFGFLGAPWAASIPCVGFVPLLIVVGALAGRQARRQHLYVTADASGLQAERFAGTRSLGIIARLRWDEVRSLSRASQGIYGASSPIIGPTIYLVDADDGHIMWATGPSAREDAVAASEYLLRQVVTRTGKPLRDLSNVAAELARGDGTARRVLPSAPELIFPAPPTAVPAVRPQRTWIGVQVAAFLLVSVLLTAALVGSGVWLQSYQSAYLAGTPLRVHSSSAVLFHDDLARPDAYWDVVPASSDVGYTAAYVGDTYQLAGPQAGSYAYGLESQTFGDGAYEVNATLSGKSSSQLDDAVGLVLHASGDGLSFLVFEVDQQGEWNLWKYRHVDGNFNDDWTDLAWGNSDAIHTDVGEANQLLVIADGSSYVFFVNEQEVGSYQAKSADNLPAYGGAGVYLDDTAMTGVFTQFSVYSLPPPAQWPPALPDWLQIHIGRVGASAQIGLTHQAARAA